MRALIVVLVILGAVCVCEGRTITVDDDGAGDFSTIQAGIDDSNDGDTVLVADGAYTGEGNRDIDFRGKRITVRSERGPESCVIDCEGVARGFYFHSEEDEDSLLQGFTITNGYDRDSGGAIYCYRSAPTITDCRFVGNSCRRHGGAIENTNSRPRFFDCFFIENVAQGHGGAINNDKSDCIVDNCIFLRNSADAVGGAILEYGSNSTFTRCLFKENSAGVNGGALYEHYSSSDVRSCIFTGNSAEEDGGAVHAWDKSNPVIVNCTFAGNRAMMRGGAVASERDSDPVVTNCIFRANRASNGNAIGVLWYFWNFGYKSEMTVRYSDVEGGYAGAYVDERCRISWQGGNIDDDPCFVDPGYWNANGTPEDENDDYWVEGDYHLTSDSPCIDSGDVDYIPPSGETDTDGEPRVMGSGIDMGIDEFGAALAPILRVWPVDFEFFSYENGPHSGPQTLHIANRGSGEMHWECVDDCGWIELSSSSGQLSMGEIAVITLIPHVSGLVPDRYDCVFTITADGAFDAPQTVMVSLDLDGLKLHVPSEFPTIQAAVDAADNWDSVIVADGTYTGPGNHDIEFQGKTITVRSENGPSRCIIDCNGTDAEPRDGFRFYSSEGPRSIVSGFTISNNYAREYCLGFPWLICYLAGGAIHCEAYGNARPTIKNCVITGGLGPKSYGLYVGYEGGSPTLINCTITGQKAGGVKCEARSGVKLRYCILRDNSSNEMSGPANSMPVEYCNVEGGWRGPGNIDADPCFVDPGYWDLNGTPEDTSDDSWLHGGADYHVQSQGGRWDANEGRWTIDDVTSPCIDAGDPMSLIGPEPFPNGGIINMGAYGGTGEASKSYFGGPACEIIVAGDIDGNCVVDFRDFRLMALHWMWEE